MFAPGSGSHRVVGWNAQVLWNGRSIASKTTRLREDAKRLACVQAAQVGASAQLRVLARTTDCACTRVCAHVYASVCRGKRKRGGVRAR